MSCFHEGIGVCENLIGTPIPLSYTRLTSRFLVLWHLTLPIILWDDCHWIVVPATFISAASLFCIEEVCSLLCLFVMFSSSFLFLFFFVIEEQLNAWWQVLMFGLFYWSWLEIRKWCCGIMLTRNLKVPVGEKPKTDFVCPLHHLI